MTDLKTTVSAIVGVLAFTIGRLGLELPTEVTDGIIALTILAVGYFARDSYNVQRSIEVNPSILPERDRSAEIRQRVSDKTKLNRID